MRVLLVTVCFPPAWQGGGSVRSIGSLARGLARAGARLRVVTTDAFLPSGERPPRERNEGGFSVTTLCVPTWMGPAANRYGLVPGLAPLLWKESRRADVCLVQGIWTWPMLVAARVCGYRDLPYVVCPRGSLEARSLSEKALRKSIYLRLVEGSHVRRAAAVLISSEAEHRRSRPITGDVPAIILPNALEALPLREPPRGLLHERLGIATDRPLIGMAGRIHPRKGFELLVPALAGADPRIHCVVFGPDDGGHASVVQRLARDSGVADRVHLVGHLDGSDLADCYASLDLLVLPSFGESFGNVVLEALAQGTEVMVSEDVPLASYVAEHRFGTVVPERSVDAWCRALSRWAAGRAGFDGRRAAERVRRDFDGDRLGARCLEELRRLVRR